MCGLLRRDNLPDVDIGYAYLPEFWGQGFAFEAAEATLRVAATRFGLSRVIGVVSEGNTGSIRVLEKVGMTLRTHVSHESRRTRGAPLRPHARHCVC